MTEDKRNNAASSQGEKPNAASEILDEARQQITGSLDTIKEILVGEYAREIHKKMLGLEDRIVREISGIQTHVTHRVATLESYVQKGFELLREEIKKEHFERGSAIDTAVEELRNTAKAYEQKLTNVSQLSLSHFNELREQILGESQIRSEEILHKYREIHEEIEKMTNNLEARKPDRQFIATLYMRMAGALQAESLTGTGASITDLKPKAIKKSG